MQFFRVMALLLCSTWLMCAAPAISGVRNSASYAEGALAPGSVATLFGSGLATDAIIPATYPLSSYLGRATVYVNGIAAPLLYVSPGQINFQVPWEVPLGRGSVIVITDNATSNEISVQIAAAAPALFAGTAVSSAWGLPLTGTGSQSRAARPGEYITLYATGVGPVSSQPANGAAPSMTILSRASTTPTVTVGGVPATVGFAGLAPLGPNPYAMPGLYQLNVLVPSDAPAGASVPVVVTAIGSASNTVNIAVAAGRSDSIARFLLLGPNSALSARVITAADTCPSITVDGRSQSMRVRAAATLPLYAVTSCEADIAAGAKSVMIDGQAMTLPVDNPTRLTVLGDTGCRMDTTASQGCNDPKAWPVEQIAQSALATNPQLLIHNGDYHYRENPCSGAAACQGSPYGFNWDVWREDMFKPLQTLLPAAPWMFVRGNHESCDRAWEGWFRFLDARPMPDSCQVYTDPYSISTGSLQLIHVDSAQADDATVFPDQVAAYIPQFDLLRQLAGSNAWVITHRPLWAIRSNLNSNVVMQAASQNNLPAGVKMIISGHTHTFQTYTFSPARAPQVIVGNSGDNLAAQPTQPLVGALVGNATVVNATSLGGYGFSTMTPQASGGWTILAKDAAGTTVATCQMQTGQVTCDK